LADGPAGYEEKTGGLVAGRNENLSAVVEEDKVLVSNKRFPLEVEIVSSNDFIAEGIFLFAEIGLSLDDVSEDGVGGKSRKKTDISDESDWIPALAFRSGLCVSQG